MPEGKRRSASDRVRTPGDALGKGILKRNWAHPRIGVPVDTLSSGTVLGGTPSKQRAQQEGQSSGPAFEGVAGDGIPKVNSNKRNHRKRVSRAQLGASVNRGASRRIVL